MGDPRGLPGGDGKAGRHRRDHHHDGKDFLPPQQQRDGAKRDRRGGRDGEHRLMVCGKIERDAGAERDGHPGQQAPGPRLGARPSAQRVEERRPAEAGRHDPTRLRHPARRPGPGIASPAARRPALVRHPAPWNIPVFRTLLEVAIRGIVEQMRNVRGKGRNVPPFVPEERQCLPPASGGLSRKSHKVPVALGTILLLRLRSRTDGNEAVCALLPLLLRAGMTSK